MKKYKSYKVFNPDWSCNGFKFVLGETYHHEGDVKICRSGFHSCLNLMDCFNYYSFNPANKVAIVEIWGEMDCYLDGDSKVASEYISITKELTWHEVLVICNAGYNNTGNSNTGNSNTGYNNTGNRNTGNSNTGHSNTGDGNTGNWNTGNSNTGHSNTGHSNTGDGNTGHRNTGDWNTGHRNTGHGNTGNRNTGNSNTGDWNTGNSNTGDWNTGNSHVGAFNTLEAEQIYVFNKLIRKQVWDNAYKPKFLCFELTAWVPTENMSEQDKKNDPGHQARGGQLKSLDYKEAFQASWDNANKEDRERVRDLPGFDAEIFYEISGIDLRDRNE